MNQIWRFEMSALSDSQWGKVTKAMAYSFFSGFAGGLILTATDYLQSGQPIDVKIIHSVVIAAVIGGLNALAVTVKQLFMPTN